jgi:hypothetical protein
VTTHSLIFLVGFVLSDGVLVMLGVFYLLAILDSKPKRKRKGVDK